MTVVWEIHADAPTGAMSSTGTFTVNVPLGALATNAITIHTPTAGTSCYLVLHAQKNGIAVFDETAEVFTLN